LASKGLADAQRMAIHGGSAGGYTVIAAMAFRSGVFKAGRSAYGICSLESLAQLTHKFEAHYLEGLLGGSIDKIPNVYRERSPIYFADNISAPLLIQQGSLDKVVPPNQAEMIVESIKKEGGRVDYQLFDGEGHGFRQAQNIKGKKLRLILSCSPEGIRFLSTCVYVERSLNVNIYRLMDGIFVPVRP
jgi:dipeptidyl aminopeptidase/acylaminoacyl peptidase